MDLQAELTQSNISIEQVMKQLQRDHSSGKLRSTAAEASRQSSRDVRENSECDSRSDEKQNRKKRNGKVDERRRVSANLPVHIPLVEPARSVSTPARV